MSVFSLSPWERPAQPAIADKPGEGEPDPALTPTLSQGERGQKTASPALTPTLSQWERGQSSALPRPRAWRRAWSNAAYDRLAGAFLTTLDQRDWIMPLSTSTFMYGKYAV